MDGIRPAYPATRSERASTPRWAAGKRSLEARWLQAAQAGYSLAFEELVVRSQDRIYRLARSIARDPGGAEDAVQATFLKAREHLHAFRIDSGFSAWLCRVGAIEALLRMRGMRFQEGALEQCVDTERILMSNELPYCADSPHEDRMRSELAQLASEETSVFKPVCRIIFFLCEEEGWSIDEAADFLGLPVSAIVASLPRTRREISEYLDRDASQGNQFVPRFCALPLTKLKGIDHERTISSTAA